MDKATHKENPKDFTLTPIQAAIKSISIIQLAAESVQEQAHLEGVLAVLSSVRPYEEAYLASKQPSWISVQDRLPLAYESGLWDGLRSDLVLTMNAKREVKLARLYRGVLDGSEFEDWYDEIDFELVIKPVLWKEI